MECVIDLGILFDYINKTI